MSSTLDITVQMRGAAQVIADTRKMSQGMSELDASGKKVGSTMQQASRGVDQFGQSTSKTASQIDKTTDAYKRLDASTTDQLRSQARLGTAVKSAGAGFALTGAAAISLWAAYDNVTDAAKRVEIAQNRVNAMELRASRAREALTKLQQSGTASSLDLAQAQQQVEVAEGRVEAAAFNATNAQESYNESLLNAATSIIPAVFSGISGITDILNAFRTRALAAAILNERLAAGLGRAGATAAASAAGIGTFTGATTAAAGAETRVTQTSAGAAGGIANVGRSASTSAIPLGAFAAAATTAAGANTLLSRTSALPLGNFGNLAKTATAAAPALGAARAATVGLGGAMSAVAGPIAIVAAAIGLAITVVHAFEKNLFGLRDAVRAFRAEIDKLIGFPPELRQQFNGLEDSGNSLIDQFGEGIPIFSDFLKWLDDIGGASKKTSDEFDPLKQQLNQTNETINKLSPAIAELAKSWGLYNNAAAQTDPIAQKQLAYLQQLDQSVQPARDNVIDLAVANGVNLKDALAMTDDQMLEFIVNAKDLGPTLQMQADQAAEAAKQFSEGWTTAFEGIQGTMGQLNEDMNGFARTAFENMGGEMDVASGHLKEKVAGSLGFNQDFWDRVFPRDVLHNVWEHNMDFDQLMADTRHIIDRATDKGFITEEQASKWFDPLLTFMKEDMPEQADEAFGYLVSSIPEMAARLKPALVRGFEIGPDVKEAVDNGIVKPFMDTLSQGLGADVAGPMMVQHIKNMMPQIQAMSGPLAGMFRQALVDPLTQQERPVQEQVQRIIELLGEINPAFADQIMEFDSNGDKIADITQKNILDPVETMKVGVLSAFETMFRVMGRTDIADSLALEIVKLTGNLDNMSTVMINGNRVLVRSQDYMKEQARKTLAADAALTQFLDTAERTTGALDEMMNRKFGETLGQEMKSVLKGQPGSDFEVSGEEMDRRIAERMGQLPGGEAKPLMPSLDTSAFEQGMNQLLTKIDQWISDINNRLGGVPDETQVSTGWNELYNKISTTLSEIGGRIASWFPGINQALSGVPDDTKVSSGWTDLYNLISQTLSDIGGRIASWFPGINQALAGVPDNTKVSSGWDQLFKIASQTLSDIGGRIGSWAPGINQALSGVPDDTKVSSGWDQLYNTISTKLSEIGGRIGSWIEGVRKSLGDLTAHLGEGTELDPSKGLIFQDPKKLLNRDSWKQAGETAGGYFNVGLAAGMVAGEPDPIEKWLTDTFGPETGNQLNSILETFGGEGASKFWARFLKISQDGMNNVTNAVRGWLPGFSKIMNEGWGGAKGPAGFGTALFGNTVIGRGAAAGAETTGGGGAAVGGGGPPVPDFSQHIAAWQNYVVKIQGFIAQIGAELIKVNQGYGLVLQGILTFNAQASAGMAIFVQNVTAAVSQTGQQLIKLVQGFGLAIQGVLTFNARASAGMGIFAQNVANSVQASGSSLIKLVQGFNLTLAAVLTFNHRASQGLAIFANNVGVMQRTASSHLTTLASNTARVMNAIIRSMGGAVIAAGRLRDAINRLQSKTITVTTVYRTVNRSVGGGGAVRAENGFSGVVSQPTRFMVGEGNKPELVQVTPLAGSASASMSSAGGNPVIRAGRGAKKSVMRTEYRADGTKIIYYSDGSRKKSHYNIRGDERWEAAVARDSGQPYHRTIANRGDYITPDGRRYKSEDMYKFEQADRQRIIDEAQRREDNKGASNQRQESTTTYTTVTKSGKVRKKEIQVDPNTGAAKRGSAETIITRHPIDYGKIVKPPSPASYMGRYGMGGIWGHQAFGGQGDVFPFPLPPGFKKTISKTYYPDGSVWNNYSDGSRELIRSATGSRKKKKKGQYGYHGIVRNPTEFTVGEGNKPERVSIEPLTGGNADRATIRTSIGDREIVISVPLYIDGKQMAKALARHTLAGISSFT